MNLRHYQALPSTQRKISEFMCVSVDRHEMLPPKDGIKSPSIMTSITILSPWWKMPIVPSPYKEDVPSHTQIDDDDKIEMGNCFVVKCDPNTFTWNV